MRLPAWLGRARTADTVSTPGKEALSRRARLLRGGTFLGAAALAVSLAFGIGIASARWTVGADNPVGDVAVGPWQTSPLAGLPEADPYTKARFARSGAMPLGPAEGLAFAAREDSAGRPLSATCLYRLVGPMPAARWWTLHVSPAPEGDGRPAALHSRGVLRDTSGGFVVNLSRGVAPGNWLALPARAPGGVSLNVTLYDTVVTRRTAMGSAEMPSIERVSCEDAAS